MWLRTLRILIEILIMQHSTNRNSPDKRHTCLCMDGHDVSTVVGRQHIEKKKRIGVLQEVIKSFAIASLLLFTDFRYPLPE